MGYGYESKVVENWKILKICVCIIQSSASSNVASIFTLDKERMDITLLRYFVILAESAI